MYMTLITTTFSASATAGDVVEGVDLHGVRAIVTGASSGIGAETARALSSAGAEVTMAVRDVAAGRAVAATIARSTSSSEPGTRHLDLADLASIAAFVAAWEGPLHLLINNAGVVTGGLERTPEGRELQFATNHLGHFALANGLHSALRDGAAAAGGARIVSVSSTAHMRSGVDFSDLDFDRRAYDPQTAYAQSKTANALFTVEATRRWAEDGIVANAVNPGGVATRLQRSFTPAQKASLDAAEKAGIFTYKSAEQGAAASTIAAVAPEFAGTGGHYIDDGQEAYIVSNDASLADHPHGVKQWALDPDLAERLWSVSAHSAS